jgi:hypothetical protein
MKLSSESVKNLSAASSTSNLFASAASSYTFSSPFSFEGFRLIEKTNEGRTPQALYD